MSEKYNRDITQREYEKCRKDCIVFKGTDSINEMLDYVLQFKGEAKKVSNKIVRNKIYILAHKGSGFDSYVFLNNLTQWRTVVSLIKDGLGIVSPKIINLYVDHNKKFNMFISDADYYILKIF